jgi:hypothetical protein
MVKTDCRPAPLCTATDGADGLELARRGAPRDHRRPACTVHVPVWLTRPAGPTLQLNSRPDCKRPVHVHATSPRGVQLTLSTVSPCVLAITRASSAACSAAVFVPKHPASSSAGAKATALRRAAASGLTWRSERRISWRGPIP